MSCAFMTAGRKAGYSGEVGSSIVIALDIVTGLVSLPFARLFSSFFFLFGKFRELLAY